MVKSRSAAASRKRWQEIASARGPAYGEGVQNPRRPWLESTLKQEDAYEAGVTQAIARKAFGKGARKVGNEGWLRGAVEKGINRYGPGITAGADKYESSMGPVIAAIEATRLPERGPRGAPQNLERVAVLARNLNKLRVGGSVGGGSK